MGDNFTKNLLVPDFNSVTVCVCLDIGNLDGNSVHHSSISSGYSECLTLKLKLDSTSVSGCLAIQIKVLKIHLEIEIILYGVH